jgi:hypothetical protein
VASLPPLGDSAISASAASSADVTCASVTPCRKVAVDFPPATNPGGLGSATSPQACGPACCCSNLSVAATGVPPAAFRGEGFRPEAENGGPDARATRRTGKGSVPHPVHPVSCPPHKPLPRLPEPSQARSGALAGAGDSFAPAHSERHASLFCGLCVLLPLIS